MPKPVSNATMTAPAAKKRSVDWKKFGARSADEGERVTWRASEVDDTISGTLVRVDEANTRFGSKVLIELDACRSVIAGGEGGADGEYVIWPTPGLINALDESEADKGDYVTITLTELIDTGKGNPFKSFDVVVSDEPF